MIFCCSDISHGWAFFLSLDLAWKPYVMDSEIALSDTDGFLFIGFLEDRCVRCCFSDDTTRAGEKNKRNLCKAVQEILRNLWQDDEYPSDIVQATCGADFEIY